MSATRLCAAAFLLLSLVALLLFCRLLTARSKRPAVHWAAAGYLAWLHLICLYGLLTSTRFEDALAPLILFTFPASAIVSDVIRNEGFATLPDLAINYVRYILCFGGTNALMIAAFLSLILPRRVALTRPQAIRTVDR